MDEGRLTDGNGTTVDFRNTIIILTSNSGTKQLREFGAGVGFNRPEEGLTGEAAESIVLKALRKQFAPEFLNRLDDIIMFNPLNKESAAKIALLEMNELKERMGQNGFRLEWTDEVVQFIVDKGFDTHYGARSLKRAIRQHIEDVLCDGMVEHPEQTEFWLTINEGKIDLH